MMRIIIIFFTLNSLFSHSKEREFNFIISVDGSLRNVYATQFILNNRDGSNDRIRVKFIQGRLSVSEKDYQKLTSENVMSINLHVRYDKTCRGKTKYFNYEIEDFKLPWLNESDFILYIYNTNNKKYKKIYDPLPGKEYTFEYDWSRGSASRMQKRLTREQKKCRVKL